MEAVYRDQVDRLTTGARQLLAEKPPAVALRQWMGLFGDWIATKNGMLDTLLTMIEAGAVDHAQTRDEILNAISAMLDAGRAAGDLRPDVTPEELAASLIGIFTVAHQPGHAVTADRLLDILLDGLRPRSRPRAAVEYVAAALTSADMNTAPDGERTPPSHRDRNAG